MTTQDCESVQATPNICRHTSSSFGRERSNHKNHAAFARRHFNKDVVDVCEGFWYSRTLLTKENQHAQLWRIIIVKSTNEVYAYLGRRTITRRRRRRRWDSQHRRRRWGPHQYYRYQVPTSAALKKRASRETPSNIFFPYRFLVS